MPKEAYKRHEILDRTQIANLTTPPAPSPPPQREGERAGGEVVGYPKFTMT